MTTQIMISRATIALSLTVCVFIQSRASAQGAAQSQSVSQAKPDDKLIGMWASESAIGPTLKGTLTVTRSGTDWSATISSAQTRFTPQSDSIRFSFNGELGQFRGALSKDQRVINGWWIQPAGSEERGPHDPGGTGQPFASKVTLGLERPNVWRGIVDPLEETFTLYLNIWRGTSGLLVGGFRNPELNLRGGSAQFRVTQAADSVLFSTRQDSTQPELKRVALYDSATKQMRVWWQQIGRHLVLLPRLPDQAVGYFPRVPRGSKYSYSAPLADNDGLPSARASSVGIDEAQLARLVQRIMDTVQTSPRTPFIHSLLVARNGKLVLEEYFSGFDRNRVHDIRSAGKTFASVMVGAAMQKGYPISAASPIAGLLPQLAPLANADPRKARITLGHLMTHSSGLDCDDNEDNSPGNEGTMQMQTAQPNWWKYMLDLRVIHDPGTYWAYCSGGSNLVGAGVAAATKTWLPEFFDRTIAQPLQFGHYYYNLMPTLEGYTGGGVFMRPRDLLKIGQLYLNGGTWNGKRIIPQSWVTQSIAKHIEWPYRNENVSAGADGYAWHLNTLRSGDRTYREYEANGNGGQLLMVIPELDLVVVFTAGNYGGGGVWGRFRDDLVPNAIIPAIRHEDSKKNN